MQYIKGRTECFHDYFPCRKKDCCKLLHVWNWLNLFIVFQQWLEGKPRNDIAADNGLSDGAVTNIVNEWKHSLGFSLADDLRELAVTMKRIGVAASQCALGSRVAMIMLNMGIKEDDFE